jgi:DNA-binding NtrC family response regulator
MSECTIVLIAVDPLVLNTFRAVAAAVGHLRVEFAAHLEAALSHLDRDDTVLAVMDLTGARGVSEMSLLVRWLAIRRRSVPAVGLGMEYIAEHAQAMFEIGAAAYLTQPLDFTRTADLVDELTHAAERALACVAASPSEETCERRLLLDVPGPHAEGLFNDVCRHARHDSTVLVTGETGTGKTSVARLIHNLSPRGHLPFVVVDCGASAADLLEAEMFGRAGDLGPHRACARIGKFEAAGAGTVFIDMIDELSIPLQIKLLRAIEDGVFKPVGSTEAKPMGARVVAAANRPLEREVAAHRFRYDLYHRLNVERCALPPLRDRPWMILPIANEYLSEFCTRNRSASKQLSVDAAAALRGYPWPGNLRELRNAIERAASFCRGATIEVYDLPDALRVAAGRAVAPTRIFGELPTAPQPNAEMPPKPQTRMDGPGMVRWPGEPDAPPVFRQGCLASPRTSQCRQRLGVTRGPGHWWTKPPVPPDARSEELRR